MVTKVSSDKTSNPPAARALRSDDAPERVLIFDTTLRDGEQAVGATMTTNEKLDLARVLSRLGVDALEVGFPAASHLQLDTVRAVTERVGVYPVQGRPATSPPIICALARTLKSDIDVAWQAIQDAFHPRIHTFIGTSEIHRTHKLNLTPEAVIEQARAAVGWAKAYCADVEFSAEDAMRTERDFLVEVLEAVIEEGATTLNIPDTVSYAGPEEYGALIRDLIASVRGIDGITISTHCHNDLGMATANTLAGLVNGARQAEVTMNGIGFRTGNAALEEVVMALQIRGNRYGLCTGIDTQQLTRSSRLTSKITGILVQPNKAIVGHNAFAGIEIDDDPNGPYRIMQPEMVGASTNQLVLGKRSDQNAFSERLVQLGFELPTENIESAFERFQQLAERKLVVSNADLEAIAVSTLQGPVKLYALEDLQVGCGTIGTPTATVRLCGPDGTTRVEAAVGSGPVDATFRAIDRIIGESTTLLEYHVTSVSRGLDALGEVNLHIAGNDVGRGLNPQSEHAAERVFHGHGLGTDTVVASARAYIMALNRLLAAKGARENQPGHVVAGMGA